MTLRTNLEIRTEHVLYAAAGIAVFYAAWRGYKNAAAFRDAALSTGAAVVDSVNPASDNNLVYSGVNSVGKVISGDKDFTLGGWIYDFTHPNQAAPFVSEDSRTLHMINMQGIGL